MYGNKRPPIFRSLGAESPNIDCINALIRDIRKMLIVVVRKIRSDATIWTGGPSLDTTYPKTFDKRTKEITQLIAFRCHSDSQN